MDGEKSVNREQSVFLKKMHNSALSQDSWSGEKAVWRTKRGRRTSVDGEQAWTENKAWMENKAWTENKRAF